MTDLEIIKENLKKHAFDSIQGRIWGQRYINYWKMKQIESLLKIPVEMPKLENEKK